MHAPMNQPSEQFSQPLLWRFRFGSAEFDEAQFELRVAGLSVEVQRKPLEILKILLNHAGEVVTKEELTAHEPDLFLRDLEDPELLMARLRNHSGLSST